MKNTLLKIVFLLFFVCATAQDEVNNTFGQQMANALAPLEKNRVPHGLLLDIAMEFTNVPAFNGTLSDSTFVENKTKIFDCYQDSS